MLTARYSKYMQTLKFKKTETLVLSVGGSLVIPNGGPNVDFLQRLKKFVDAQLKQGRKLVLVVGGGKTARHYIEAAKQIGDLNTEDLDWIGIHSTRLNGHLLRTIFRKVAHPVVIKNPTRTPKKWKGRVLIAAGWKPGWSTDYVACRIAKRIGATTVLNLSNIDHVYSEDPRDNPKAEKFDALSWKEYRGMIADEWDPGLSAPFDPIASKFCHKYKLRAVIMSGDLKNVSAAVAGKKFKGTILS